MDNNLKELRKKKGLSQKEFAKDFNKFIKENSSNSLYDNQGKIKKISYATVSRWENGKTPIPSIYYQSLADFFGVSVPYLQGIEPNFREVTEETENILAETLNKYYFGKVEDHRLRTADSLRKSVDKYLELKKVLRRPSDFYSEKETDFKLSPRIKKYWLKNFSFLLEIKSLVGHINKISFKFKNERDITRGEARWIIQSINREITNTFKTDFGYYYEHNYLSDEYKKHVEFTQNLLTAENIENLDNSFLEYRNYLDDLHKKLKSDLKNGNPIKRDKEKREEAKRFLAEREDLFKE